MSVYQDVCGREVGPEWKFDPCYLRRNVLSSKFFLEKYEMKGLLKGHSGCVNSVLFSQDGQYIFTGSDDTNVNIYSTEGLELVESFPSIHTNNIFYARDLPGSDMNTIITCAADGRVAVTNLATKAARKLYRHRGRAHRIALVPYQNNQFYSCGEDGVCCLFDLRDGASSLFEEQGSSLEENIFTPALKTEFKNNRDRVCSIYTVGVNPLNPYEVAVAGSSNHIALYDSRRFDAPTSFLCPEKLAGSSVHVTGLKYDHTGGVLIGSYNDEDVYSFFVQENALSSRRTAHNDRTTTAAASAASEDSYFEEDVRQRGYYRRYTGHRNNNTVKQVSFMGGRSDYVISGSDCGHLFIWDTHTAKLVQLLKGDNVGAINCLAAHPYLPLLATSGLENDAKVWEPSGEHRPITEGSEKARLATRLTANNSERSAGRAYSDQLLSLLMSLLSRGDLPLHGESDEDEDSSGGEENSESGRSGESGEGAGDSAEEGEYEEMGEGSDSAEGGDDADGGSEGPHIGPQPRRGVRRDRCLRQRRRGTAEEEQEHEDPEAGADLEEGDGDDGDDSQRDGSGTEDGSDESMEEGMEEGETVSMADLAEGRVGLVIDGVPVPWSQLARFLPALLGRRRRSDSDTGDEAKEEDAEERAAQAAAVSVARAREGEEEVGDGVNDGPDDEAVPDLEEG